MHDLINPKCFSQEWIISKSKEFSGDPTLIEKTIRAFALLGYIAQLEEDFIFKGGTSLLLHVPKIKRLSIDIDIIYGDNIENFISKLSDIPKSSNFTRFEEGVSRISSHLLKDRFLVDSKAKITASKVLFVANSIKNGIAINFNTDKYSEDKFSILEAITLQKPYERLNRLKPILPEVFYYIWKAVE